MLDEKAVSQDNCDGSDAAEIISATASVRANWSAWLERGWHGVKVAEWASLYLPAKLDADIRFLDLLVEQVPAFARVAQRHRRETVGDLVRDQYLLPWTRKKNPQFFAEQRAGLNLHLTDCEHGFPVAQIKSLVLMALEAGDVELARKRLVYCWLIPTVHCTNETHRSLPRRCTDFDRPLDRYSMRHEKLQQLALRSFDGIATNIRRFDGTIIDPDHYSRSQTLDDLSSIEQIRPIVDGLDGLTFPDPDEEAAYTNSMRRRGAAGPIV